MKRLRIFTVTSQALPMKIAIPTLKRQVGRILNDVHAPNCLCSLARRFNMRLYNRLRLDVVVSKETICRLEFCCVPIDCLGKALLRSIHQSTGNHEQTLYTSTVTELGPGKVLTRRTFKAVLHRFVVLLVTGHSVSPMRRFVWFCNPVNA